MLLHIEENEVFPSCLPTKAFHAALPPEVSECIWEVSVTYFHHISILCTEVLSEHSVIMLRRCQAFVYFATCVLFWFTSCLYHYVVTGCLPCVSRSTVFSLPLALFVDLNPCVSLYIAKHCSVLTESDITRPFFLCCATLVLYLVLSHSLCF